MEVLRASGIMMREPGLKNADIEQLKAILAIRITKVLDGKKLTLRTAYEQTGIPAADFSRIRNAALAHFTIDRLMRILNRLGTRVDVKVKVRSVRRLQRVRDSQ